MAGFGMRTFGMPSTSSSPHDTWKPFPKTQVRLDAVSTGLQQVSPFPPGPQISKTGDLGDMIQDFALAAKGLR
jgi:hypothetical protein